MQNAVGVLHLAELRSGLKRIEFQVHPASRGTPSRFFLRDLHACGIDYYSEGAGTRDGRDCRCRAGPRRSGGSQVGFRALGANGCDVQVLIVTYQPHETATG